MSHRWADHDPTQYPDAWAREQRRPEFATDINLPSYASEVPSMQVSATRPSREPALFHCVVGVTRARQPPVLHAHQGMELGIVLRGMEEHQFGDLHFRDGPGDIWLCGMWEPHAFREMRAGTIKVVVFFLPEFLGDDPVGHPPYLSLFSLPPGRRPRAAGAATRRRLLAIGREMAREILREEPLWENAVRLHLVRAMVELVRIADASLFVGKPGNLGHTEFARIVPAVQLVQREPAQRVTNAEAAAACALSESRFEHLFARVMGVSFGQFRLRARAALAAQRLLYTSDSLQRIADDAGFADPRHLHRSFVKHYGCAPGEYRERSRRTPRAT